MVSEKRILQGLLNAFRIHLHNEDAVDLCTIERIIQDYGDLIEDSACVFTSDAASLAWDDVLQKIRAVGSYDTVVFEDPLIHAVIQDMGGWVYMCGLTARILFLRAEEFKMRYADYQKRPVVSYPMALKGRL